MNKLISRNPVLRFKLGRKIVKAKDGDEVPRFPFREPKLPTLTYEPLLLTYWGDAFKAPSVDKYPYKGNKITIGVNPNKYSIADWSFQTENLLPTEQANQKIIVEEKKPESKSQVKGNSQSKRIKKSGTSSFAKAFKEARAKGLKEFVWNGLKKNTMKAGETKEQWLKNLGIEAPQQKEVVASNQPVMEKVKTQTVVPSSQEIGNWTQALIEAQQPQLIVSSNYIPTSEDVMNWMQSFKYKQGGQLPSRNIVRRFKSRKSN